MQTIDRELNLVLCKCGHWLEWLPIAEVDDPHLDDPAWGHPLTTTNCVGEPNWPTPSG